MEHQSSPKLSVLEKLAQIGESTQIVEVPVSDVRPFANQPREYFDQEDLQGLAESIKAVGQQMPGKIRPLKGIPGFKWELIDGQRRWHAVQMAGRKLFRAIVVQVNDPFLQLVISAVSNFGRSEHTALEVARTAQRLVDGGLAVAEVASVFGRSQPYIYQHIRLLSLVGDLQRLLGPPTPRPERLSVSAASLIAQLPQNKQMEAFSSAQSRGGGIRMTEQVVRQLLGKSVIKQPKSTTNNSTAAPTSPSRASSNLGSNRNARLQEEEEQLETPIEKVRIVDMTSLGRMLLRAQEQIFDLCKVARKCDFSSTRRFEANFARQNIKDLVAELIRLRDLLFPDKEDDD